MLLKLVFAIGCIVALMVYGEASLLVAKAQTVQSTQTTIAVEQASHPVQLRLTPYW